MLRLYTICDRLRNMKHWWNDTEGGKAEVLGEKPVPVALYPLQIPHGLAGDCTKASAASSWHLTT